MIQPTEPPGEATETEVPTRDFYHGPEDLTRRKLEPLGKIGQTGKYREKRKEPQISLRPLHRLVLPAY